MTHALTSRWPLRRRSDWHQAENATLEICIAKFRVISRERFRELTRSLIGLPVSHTWRGYGSAIFLELGQVAVDPRCKHPRGEASIMIEWSWRIEGPRSIRLGSWSHERKLTNGVADLAGRRVEELSLTGRLPELELQLSGGRWVHSFMTFEGHPAWTVFLRDGTWLCIERGRLILDNLDGADSRRHSS